MKQISIDHGDTDVESDEENVSDEDNVIKDRNRIENAIKEFKRRGNTYFEDCNKEKIETISKWCNRLNHNGSKMVKKYEDYEEEYSGHFYTIDNERAIFIIEKSYQSSSLEKVKMSKPFE